MLRALTHFQQLRHDRRLFSLLILTLTLGIFGTEVEAKIPQPPGPTLEVRLGNPSPELANILAGFALPSHDVPRSIETLGKFVPTNDRDLMLRLINLNAASVYHGYSVQDRQLAFSYFISFDHRLVPRDTLKLFVHLLGVSIPDSNLNDAQVRLDRIGEMPNTVLPEKFTGFALGYASPDFFVRRTARKLMSPYAMSGDPSAKPLVLMAIAMRMGAVQKAIPATTLLNDELLDQYFGGELGHARNLRVALASGWLASTNGGWIDPGLVRVQVENSIAVLTSRNQALVEYLSGLGSAGSCRAALSGNP